MKKYLLGFFIILLLVGVFWLFKTQPTVKNPYKDFTIINYNLQAKNYRLLLADTPTKWERGLMYFRKLEGADGMIFLFPDKQTRTFWNKNTFMDLEVYWLNGNNVVGSSFLPSIEKSKEIVMVSSREKVDKVIELPTRIHPKLDFFTTIQ